MIAADAVFSRAWLATLGTRKRINKNIIDYQTQVARLIQTSNTLRNRSHVPLEKLASIFGHEHIARQQSIASGFPVSTVPASLDEMGFGRDKRSSPSDRRNKQLPEKVAAGLAVVTSQQPKPTTFADPRCQSSLPP